MGIIYYILFEIFILWLVISALEQSLGNQYSAVIRFIDKLSLVSNPSAYKNSKKYKLKLEELNKKKQEDNEKKRYKKGLNDLNLRIKSAIRTGKSKIYLDSIDLQYLDIFLKRGFVHKVEPVFSHYDNQNDIHRIKKYNSRSKVKKKIPKYIVTKLFSHNNNVLSWDKETK